MPDPDDLFRDRWEKMPPVIAGFAVGGVLLGVLVAILIVGGDALHWRGARFLFGLISCVGFAVGLVVGVIVDTVVFKPLRDKARERRRRERKRQRDEEARERWRQ
jgi:MFS family permease